MSTSRERICEIATLYDKTGVDYPTTTEFYLDLVAPTSVDTDQTRSEMKRQYGCSLFVRGMWREMGCDHRLLLEPYRNGKGPADVLEIATERGAKVKLTGKRGPKPRAGDAYYCLIPSNGAREHFGLIIDVLPNKADGSWVFRTVEGGQGTHGSNVLMKIREMRVDASRVWVGDRQVLFFFDLNKVLKEDVSPTDVGEVVAEEAVEELAEEAVVEDKIEE